MSDYLPDNVIIDILCRLPVDSLLRFRCVCKLWCSLISSPVFITTHLSHSLSPTTPLLLLRHLATRPNTKEHYSIYSSDTENFTLVKQLNCPFKTRSGNQYRIVGLCNGLFCLSDDLYGYTYTIILWNPAIRKSILLPKPTVHYGPTYGPYMFCLGFGVDVKTNDVKVVRIAYLQAPNGAYTVLPPTVEVYSLSTGSWKTVNSKGVHCNLIEYFYTSVYLNGSIHWVCFRKNEDGVFSNSLLVFDLGNEKFSEMGLPEELVYAYPLDLSVSLCGDGISMIWYEKGRAQPELCDHCVVWVMKEYGNVESWVEKFVVVLEGGISHAVGFLRGNREFLVEKWIGDLLSYDPERNEFKDLGIHGAKDSFFLSRYMESLVLLDGSNGATADLHVASEATRLQEDRNSSFFMRMIEIMVLRQGGIDDPTMVETQPESTPDEKEILRGWYLHTVYTKANLADDIS